LDAARAEAAHDRRGRVLNPKKVEGPNNVFSPKEDNMTSMLAITPVAPTRPILLAVIAGLASALVIGKTLPATMDALSAAVAPLCANAAEGSSLDKVEPIASYPLPNVPGKRVTIVRVFYGPGGFSRAHRHAGSVTAYITKGEIRSQLGGGPLETFKVGQSFFEPPGSTHLVSANASSTEPAELIAVFVADEGAQLTTFLE
jgi:quercetin dioxygenase-like cupin family protein